MWRRLRPWWFPAWPGAVAGNSCAQPGRGQRFAGAAHCGAACLCGRGAGRLAVAGHAVHTGCGCARAWLLAAALAIPLGIALGLSPRAARLSALSIELLRPIPSVALIPLAMLVFGFGLRMESSVVAFAAFWPMLILTRAAVSQVEPRLLEVSLVLGLSPWQRGLEDRAAGDRAAPVRGLAPGRGGVAGGRRDGGDRRQPQWHGLRDDDRAAKPGSGADAGLAGLDRRGRLRHQRGRTVAAATPWPGRWGRWQ